VLFVVVGVAQLTFSVLVLTEGWSRYWFLYIMIAGVALNTALIIYTVNSIMAGRKKPDVTPL
jgi:hypothetical protein